MGHLKQKQKNKTFGNNDSKKDKKKCYYDNVKSDMEMEKNRRFKRLPQ